MKKYLLLLLMSLPFASFVQAEQEGYRPFAQEGKTWEAREGMIMENIYGNCIDGDTLIDGENWKKVYNYHGFPEFNYSYYAAIRDVGTKVYAIAKGSSRPRLLYDFGLKEGQTVRCGVEGNAFGCLLDADEKPDTLLGFEFASSLWWPLQSQHAFVTSCYVDKTLIFGFSDFYMSSMQENSAIQGIRTSIPAPDGGAAYDLLGRRLSSIPTKGIYIQNGKKRIFRAFPTNGARSGR